MTDPDLFINRELSWLDFNDRVLQLAEDEHLPLIERLKFLAIFVTNLDEFFQIRVAGVHDQVDAHVDARGPDGLTPAEVLRGIHDTVTEQDARHARAFSQVVSPELAEQGVRIVSCDESGAAPETIEEHFREQIFPVLTPLAVGAGRAVPVHLRSVAVADRPPARSRDPTRTTTPASRCPRRSCRGSWRSRRTRSSRSRT